MKDRCNCVAGTGEVSKLTKERKTDMKIATSVHDIKNSENEETETLHMVTMAGDYNGLDVDLSIGHHSGTPAKVIVACILDALAKITAGYDEWPKLSDFQRYARNLAEKDPGLPYAGLIVCDKTEPTSIREFRKEMGDISLDRTSKLLETMKELKIVVVYESAPFAITPLFSVDDLKELFGVCPALPRVSTADRTPQTDEEADKGS